MKILRSGGLRSGGLRSGGLRSGGTKKRNIKKHKTKSVRRHKKGTRTRTRRTRSQRKQKGGNPYDFLHDFIQQHLFDDVDWEFFATNPNDMAIELFAENLDRFLETNQGEVILNQICVGLAENTNSKAIKILREKLEPVVDADNLLGINLYDICVILAHNTNDDALNLLDELLNDERKMKLGNAAYYSDLLIHLATNVNKKAIDLLFEMGDRVDDDIYNKIIIGEMSTNKSDHAIRMLKYYLETHEMDADEIKMLCNGLAYSDNAEAIDLLEEYIKSNGNPGGIDESLARNPNDRAIELLEGMMQEQGKKRRNKQNILNTLAANPNPKAFELFQEYADIDKTNVQNRTSYYIGLSANTNTEVIQFLFEQLQKYGVDDDANSTSYYYYGQMIQNLSQNTNTVAIQYIKEHPRMIVWYLLCANTNDEALILLAEHVEENIETNAEVIDWAELSKNPSPMLWENFSMK